MLRFHQEDPSFFTTFGSVGKAVESTVYLCCSPEAAEQLLLQTRQEIEANRFQLINFGKQEQRLRRESRNVFPLFGSRFLGLRLSCFATAQEYAEMKKALNQHVAAEELGTLGQGMNWDPNFDAKVTKHGCCFRSPLVFVNPLRPAPTPTKP